MIYVFFCVFKKINKNIVLLFSFIVLLQKFCYINIKIIQNQQYLRRNLFIHVALKNKQYVVSDNVNDLQCNLTDTYLQFQNFPREIPPRILFYHYILKKIISRYQINIGNENASTEATQQTKIYTVVTYCQDFINL